jgi:predicted secreted hydrolase
VIGPALHRIGTALLVLATASLSGATSTDSWTLAVPGRRIVLPADHASHPDYRLEWWYYTGNLDGTDGRRFGYQLTFFRIGIVRVPTTPSVWAVRDLFMAHLAVTDGAGRRYLAAEKLNRAGVSWAGAQTGAYRVWNEDWSARLDGDAHVLSAATAAFGLELRLGPGKPAALNGRGGYSRKGSDAGNASYYYSLTRMPTRGAITVDGARIPVTGTSWMDHEFGTSFLERGQTGWDWFSIQLEDGTDLMLYRLRRSDGSVDGHSSGTIVKVVGSPRTFGRAAFSLGPGRVWTSTATAARYPVEWRISLPTERLDLTARALVDGQELTGAMSGVAYWEGAIDVAGAHDGRRVRGRGYLEMTGYAGRRLEGLLSGSLDVTGSSTDTMSGLHGTPVAITDGVRRRPSRGPRTAP